ncbi:MAG: hypothetical protein PXZ08_11565 [Actinomycetota bacterium]|nr:hypothetical protein [Actinomycetota bacterium]
MSRGDLRCGRYGLAIAVSAGRLFNRGSHAKERVNVELVRLLDEGGVELVEESILYCCPQH